MPRASASEWLAALRWTEAHAAAFVALDERSRMTDGHRATFEQLWPATEVIDLWLDAVFVESALACARQVEPKTTATHARLLIQQAKRSWGWGQSEHREPVQARGALIAALSGEWDAVAIGLGGRPLARTVSPNKTYDSLRGLVRHLATAAKHRLGEERCATPLKAWAEAGRSSPAELWALARLAIEGAGGHPRGDVPTRFQAILAGENSTSTATPRQRPSVVDDPRVSVFERFMSVLADPKAEQELVEWADFLRNYLGVYGERRPWDSHLERWIARASVMGKDALIEGVMPVLLDLNPLSTGIEPSPAYVFLAMLGKDVGGWNEMLIRDLRRFHKPKALSTLRRYRWSTAAAAVALAAGDTSLVKKLAPGPAKAKFLPGKTFGDEPRGVLHYFARALESGATRDDVTPAWIELLATRVPDDADKARPGGAWGWGSLFCLAFVYFHRLGGAPAADVPRLLRETLQGRG